MFTRLALFTASFPYLRASEHTFLENELKILQTGFDQVILLPQAVGGERYAISPQITVDESYAKAIEQAWKSAAKSIPLIFADLIRRPRLLLSPLACGRLFFDALRAQQTATWLETQFKRGALNPDSTLFYSYWLDFSTLGVGLLRARYPGLRVISRAHNFDLYEERYSPPYAPCRDKALAGLDVLFPDSEAGTEYVSRKYPWFAGRCETARLGVRGLGFTNPGSQDGVFRISSCSFMKPVKRVDRILAGIRRAAELCPEQSFEWHHVGDGEQFESICAQAKHHLPANARGIFHGRLAVDALRNFYRDTPIDVFINASAFEGTPVSIMEVISCGIPLIVTAVGGNREIAAGGNGIVLSSDPSGEEVAQAILMLHASPQQLQQMRAASLRSWQEHYDADKNFADFVQRLKKIT